MPDLKNPIEDLDEIEQALHLLSVQEARHDIEAFAELVMRDEFGDRWVLGKHQKEWLTLTQNYNIKKLQIMAARLSSKTDTFICALLYMIGRNPNIVIKYVSGADDLAVDIVGKISNNIVNNKDYNEVFPHVVPEGTWDKHNLFIKRPAALGIKDATIEASGVTSAGTGGRCHLLVLDDVVDSRVAISEPGRLAKIQKAIEADWINTLYPGGRIWLIGTPWSYEPPDINVSYAHDAAIRLTPFNDLQYLKDMKSDDWILWFGPAILPDGSPLWPEKWPLDALEQRRRSINNQFVWEQQFMLKGGAGSGEWFEEGWLQKCMDKSQDIRHMNIPDDWPRYAGVDPASSFAKTASNSAVFVSAVSPEGRRYPVEIFYGKLSPKELAEKVIEIHIRHRPVMIMCENNGYQSALMDLIKVLAGQNGGIYPALKGQFTGSQKWIPERGLPKLSAGMSAGLWCIPTGGDHSGIDHECEVCQWLSEMRKFGKERTTTDVLMSMWLCDCAIEEASIFSDVPVMSARRTIDV